MFIPISRMVDSNLQRQLAGTYARLTPSGKTSVGHFVTNFIQSVITTAKPILAATAADLEPIIAAFISAWNTYSGPIAEDVRAPVAAAVKVGILGDRKRV